MGINPVFDHAVSQEGRLAEARGAVEFLSQTDPDKQKLKENPDLKNTDVEKLDEPEKTDVQKFLSGKKGDASKRVLARLASSVASMGLKLGAKDVGAKISGRMADEHDLLLAQSKGLDADQVDVKSLLARGAVTGVSKRDQRGKSGSEGQGDRGQDQRQLFKQYTRAVTEAVMKGGTEGSSRVKTLETQLQQMGVQVSELHQAGQEIRLRIRQELTRHIKSTLLKRIMSPTKSVEHVMADRAFNDVVDSIFFNPRLGGYYFGGHHTHLQGAVDEQQRQLQSELKDFVRLEMDKAVMKEGAGESADKEMEQILKLGEKVGFNAEAFMQTIPQKMDNWGLIPIPPSILAQAGGGQSAADEESRREARRAQYDTEDEKELLINQLRALYMQRILRGNFQAVAETALKIRRCKNGLLRLGVEFKDGDFARIEKEARGVAGIKAYQMIEEAYAERATLFELTGPAYKLIERRIKVAVRNWERISGRDMDPHELILIRNKVNEAMGSTALAELQQVQAAQAMGENPILEKKEGLLIKLLERLKDESHIVIAVPQRTTGQAVEASG